MESNPGFPIGPGGNPLFVYVLYGESVCKSLTVNSALPSNVVVDVTDVVERKAEAIRMCTNQR